jgi:glycosyltransferase involved in cell wall biosynthesis
MSPDPQSAPTAPRCATGRRCRLLVISHFFPPELGAAAKRMGEITAILAKEHGVAVTVTTGPPRYALYVDPAPGPPPGVEVVRVPAPAPRGSEMRRVLDYAAFAAGAALRWSLCGGCFDMVLATVPPLTAGLAGLWASRALGAPLILDVRDLWPEEPFRAGLLERDSVAGRLAEGLAHHIVPRADGWTATSQGILDGLQRLGADPRRSALIWNGPERWLLELEPRAPQDGTVSVVYAGLMGRAQGLGAVLEAAERLRGEERLRFRLVGAGVNKLALEELASWRRLSAVSFEGPYPPARTLDVLRTASVILAPLREGLRATIPAKLLEGMALGRPVLLAGEGEAAALVREAGAGVVVPPGDADALADALRDRLARPEEWEAMGRRGRAFMRAREGRSESTQRLAALAREILGIRGVLGAGQGGT